MSSVVLQDVYTKGCTGRAARSGATLYVRVECTPARRGWSRRQRRCATPPVLSRGPRVTASAAEPARVSSNLLQIYLL